MNISWGIFWIEKNIEMARDKILNNFVRVWIIVQISISVESAKGTLESDHSDYQKRLYAMLCYVLGLRFGSNIPCKDNINYCSCTWNRKEDPDSSNLCEFEKLVHKVED